ncbi:MAG: DeoR/GlpR family DNA-binding transcription regulator, partial [Planctomycetota bacterium]
ADEKRAIGMAAAELVTDGQTILLDGGTTCYQVARAIAGRRLSVVTNSLPIASLLSGDMATEVTLIGGYVYPRTGVALGSMAEQQLEAVHGSQLILSCAGVAEEGTYNQNQMMVDVERRMMEVADEVILVVDHSKFGQRAVARLCELGEVHVIVTDEGLDDQTHRWLQSLAARIVIAAGEGDEVSE